MSRIHEALKRAEQDRPAPQSGPEFVEPSTSLEEQAVGTDVMPVPSIYSPASPAATASSELLLSRCRQTSWNPDPKAMLFFSDDERLLGKEEFRTLRSRLLQAREKTPISKLLIASPLPKEGKSFTAANLAQVIVRQHGQRALLIDTDLRNPQLHSLLGAEAGPGISEYLSSQIDEFSVIQRGPMENLFFIPAGRSGVNPAELIANRRLKFLMDRIEPLFDWIIIDSPPAALVSDAGVLANYCDAVLLVLRSNATPVDAARRAAKEFPAEKIMGVVLNGIPPELSPYSQYYYTSYGQNGSNGSAKRD